MRFSCQVSESVLVQPASMCWTGAYPCSLPIYCKSTWGLYDVACFYAHHQTRGRFTIILWDFILLLNRAFLVTDFVWLRKCVCYSGFSDRSQNVQFIKYRIWLVFTTGSIGKLVCKVHGLLMCPHVSTWARKPFQMVKFTPSFSIIPI